MVSTIRSITKTARIVPKLIARYSKWIQITNVCCKSGQKNGSAIMQYGCLNKMKFKWQKRYKDGYD